MQDTQTQWGKEEKKGGEWNWYLPFFLHSFDVVHIFHSGVSANYEKTMVKKITTQKRKTTQNQTEKMPSNFASFWSSNKHSSYFFPALIVHLTRNVNLHPPSLQMVLYLPAVSNLMTHALLSDIQKEDYFFINIQNKFHNNHVNWKYMPMLKLREGKKSHIPFLSCMI